MGRSSMWGGVGDKIIELLGKEEISGGENGSVGIKCIKGEGRVGESGGE